MWPQQGGSLLKSTDFGNSVCVLLLATMPKRGVIASLLATLVDQAIPFLTWPFVDHVPENLRTKVTMREFIMKSYNRPMRSSAHAKLGNRSPVFLAPTFL